MLTLLLLAFLAGSPKPLPFDPHSVIKVEYRAQDCKQDGERTVCKQATFTFGGIAVQQSQPNSEAPITSSFVRPVASSKPLVDILYRPQECKMLVFDPKGRYLCKHVSWKTHAQK